MLSTNTVINEKEEKEMYQFPADQLEKTVIRFVRKLGIRPNLSGYHLLIKAILMALNSPDLLKSMTKELYPKIADDCGINVKSVERNMRKAIDSAYEYDPQRIRSVFYYKVDKPYISEVLSMAVESIRYEL